MAASPASPSSVQLTERACASFNRASILLNEAASDISASCGSPRAKRQREKAVTPSPHFAPPRTGANPKAEAKEELRALLHTSPAREETNASAHSPPFLSAAGPKAPRKQKVLPREPARLAPANATAKKKARATAHSPSTSPSLAGLPVPPQKRKVLHGSGDEQTKRKARATAHLLTTSPFFPEPFSRRPTPRGLSFKLQPSLSPCQLIQERICADLFALVVQAILWNKTRGAVARPVLWTFLSRYPTATTLAIASVDDVKSTIQTLGLQQERARRLVAMAQVWVATPPSPEKRYQRRDYPSHGNGRDARKAEVLTLDDPREGWEIAHLPGVGEYALDSFRIFGRDRLRGVYDQPGVEPEWKRLVPRDKELGPFVKWKWAQEGWDYDVETGI